MLNRWLFFWIFDRGFYPLSCFLVSHPMTSGSILCSTSFEEYVKEMKSIKSMGIELGHHNSPRAFIRTYHLEKSSSLHVWLYQHKLLHFHLQLSVLIVFYAVFDKFILFLLITHPGGGGGTQYKSGYRDVPQTWVAKSGRQVHQWVPFFQKHGTLMGLFFKIF